MTAPDTAGQWPPLPPFTRETAAQKVRMAEDGWNSRNPEKVALSYSVDSWWKNRSEFIQGRSALIEFLTRKWKTELEYRLVKELRAFDQNRIAIRFAYEWHDESGKWYRSCGNHTGCGFTTFTDDELNAKISASTADASPAPMRFISYKDPEQNIWEQIKKVRSHPWIAKEVPVRGFVFDMETGLIREIQRVARNADWNRLGWSLLAQRPAGQG
jgi:nuclear transport factor 2 (NTF2) superfamily protein